ncbi:MAG TPA: hypothetical protein VNE62_09865, partial [Actinomycetota bacterium]|nr:hypothetical protein [Actinomycetota bacterium]
PVPSWTLGSVDAAISDVPLVLRNAVAFDGPPAFAGWGVGGFLSPQHLHETAFIVIDLSHDSLVAVEGDAAAVSAWLTSRYPDLRPLEVKREPGELVVIEASVAGSQPIRAQINTGTDLTEVSPHAAGGLRGTAPLEIGYGVSGTEVEGEHATGQTLRVSDWEWPVPRVLTREQPPCDDGAPPLQAQVGMDLLRATVLAVSADRSLPVLWLVPPGEA